MTNKTVQLTELAMCSFWYGVDGGHEIVVALRDDCAKYALIHAKATICTRTDRLSDNAFGYTEEAVERVTGIHVNSNQYDRWRVEAIRSWTS